MATQIKAGGFNFTIQDISSSMHISDKHPAVAKKSHKTEKSQISFWFYLTSRRRRFQTAKTVKKHGRE